jgi:hypothetical protein
MMKLFDQKSQTRRTSRRNRSCRVLRFFPESPVYKIPSNKILTDSRITAFSGKNRKSRISRKHRANNRICDFRGVRGRSQHLTGLVSALETTLRGLL